MGMVFANLERIDLNLNVRSHEPRTAIEVRASVSALRPGLS
jgi:hypothetical protein